MSTVSKQTIATDLIELAKVWMDVQDPAGQAAIFSAIGCLTPGIDPVDRRRMWEQVVESTEVVNDLEKCFIDAVRHRGYQINNRADEDDLLDQKRLERRQALADLTARAVPRLRLVGAS